MKGYFNRSPLQVIGVGNDCENFARHRTHTKARSAFRIKVVEIIARV